MRPVERLDRETGEVLEIYETVADAGRWLKVNNMRSNSSHISACCKGKLPHTGGFNWKYHNVVDLPDEEWREIPPEFVNGHTGFWASTEGRIKDFTIIKQCIQQRGYIEVYISKLIMVHRLVAQTFLPNPDNLPEVNHKDENKSNNKLSNLEWISRQDNIDYSQAKKVAKCDKNDNVLEVFISVHEAAKSINKPFRHISTVCNNYVDAKGYQVKTAYGFKWKFV